MGANHIAATRYDRLSIFFHWATVLLIVAVFASIEMRQLFTRGTPERIAAKEWHYVLGIALFLLTMARLSHRFGSGRAIPARAQQSELIILMSKAMHWTLYFAMVALPVLGIITTSALGDPVRLFSGVELPPIMAKNRESGKWLEAIHVFIGNALYYLIGIHAIAALVHHYVWRDSTLNSMLPQRQSENQPISQI